MTKEKPVNQPKDQKSLKVLREIMADSMDALSKGSDLDTILELQTRGIFINKTQIPRSAYLQAADEGYSANLLSDGRVYFHINTERIIEDPESSLRGNFCSQRPYESEHVDHSQRGC